MAPNAALCPAPCDTLPLALGPERGDVAGPGEGGESRSWPRTRRLGGRWREVGSRSGDERRSDPSAPPRPINAVVVPCLTSLPNAQLERRGRAVGATSERSE